MPSDIAATPEPPKEPAWIPPTVRLSTEDVAKLLGGNAPEMDAVVNIVAKVTGMEKGSDRNYDTGEAKPRQSVTLEVQSVDAGQMEQEEPGEMEEPEMEGVMSDEEEEAALGYKRPKNKPAEAPLGGAVY